MQDEPAGAVYRRYINRRVRLQNVQDIGIKIKDNGVDAPWSASVVYRSYMSEPTTSRYAIRFYFYS